MLPFTLKQLRILETVASEKNFTKAAELLYLSQPSLSKQIKNLEQNLDTLLMNREGNQISLTKNGEILLRYSERILALCEESCRAFINLKNGERGNLSLGASQPVGSYLIPRILILLLKNYPQVTLKAEISSNKIIVNQIISRKVDIAIVEGDIPAKLKKSLMFENFVYDELTLIISKLHPFTKKKIEKNDLYSLNFISLDSNLIIKKYIDNLLIQNKIQTKKLKTILQLKSFEEIKTAVSLGLGAAFVSSSAIEKELKLQTIKVVKINDIQLIRKLSVIANSNYYKSKVLKIFYDELSRLKSKLENL